MCSAKTQYIFLCHIDLIMSHSDLHLLLGPGILTTEGEQHRRQRKLLNPVFSAAHLRNMTHIFYNVAHDVCMTVRDAD